MISKQPTGWKPWHYIRTRIESYIVPYGDFPKSYLPSNKFWAQSVSLNCSFPFSPISGQQTNPFSPFLSSGGLSETLMGDLGGAAAAAISSNIPSSNRDTWGIGYNHEAPTLGYCIGKQYKENAYFTAILASQVDGNFLGDLSTDVFQRSILKRIYVHHGEVTGFTIDQTNAGDKESHNGILSIDVSGIVPKSVLDESIQLGTITIYKRGTVAPPISLSIMSLLSNWTMKVSVPKNTTVSPGDFYVFPTPLCIEDPLMISGFWKGNESDNKDQNIPKSKYDLHVTSYNVPYGDITFTGAYIWQDKQGKTQLVSSDSPLNDESDGEWTWDYFKETSEIYGKEPKRWKEVTTVSKENVQGEEVAINQVKEFKIGSFSSWSSLPNVSFYRLEANIGGTAWRQNWHSPVLKQEWLVQNSRYFKILNQLNGNVIDVSIKDVTGNSEFNARAPASLLNQYAWMINEHYMTDSHYGIFSGTVSSAKYDTSTGKTTMSIKEDETPYKTKNKGTKSSNDSFNPQYLNGNNSFYNRFTIDAKNSIIKSSMRAIYHKGSTWKFVSGNGFFSTKDIKVKDGIIELIVNGDASSYTSGYIAFDTPYTVANGKLGANVVLNGSLTNHSPFVCMDAQWVSAIVNINIASDSMVGICGGYLWGVGTDENFIASDDGLNLFVTCPFALSCLAAMYDDMLFEDWVAYSDYYTKKLTFRIGSLNFKDSPIKQELILTGDMETGNGSGSTLILDSKKERLKGILISLPSASKSGEILTFGIKNRNDIYGFLVSGKGIVDLQALREQGHAPGTIPPSDYQFQGSFSSPVYTYKKGFDLFTEKAEVAIGMDIKDSPIYVLGGGSGEAVLQYIKNKQILLGERYFGIHCFEDNEKVIVYNGDVSEFSINGKQYNSSSMKNLWTNQSGVFISGSGNNGGAWGCPIFKTMNYTDNSLNNLLPATTDSKYPLMVLPDSAYMGSVVDPNSQRIIVFARCSNSKLTSFIGCLSISCINLIYKLYKCVPKSDSDLSFLFRPLSIPQKTINDPALSYAIPSEIKDLPFETSASDMDIFSRVIGSTATKSNITEESDINIISPFIMEDGSLVLLYDSNDGIKMAFSTNGGKTWNGSSIIIARNAHSPLYVRDNVIAYITASGIEIKTFIDMNILSIIWANNQAGNTQAFNEGIQQAFDNASKYIIGSGQIDAQKLAGYKTNEGITKIFFYDPNGMLSCSESSDMITWNISANF